MATDIYMNSKKVFGIVDDEVFHAFYTDEAEEFDTDTMTKVGEIDTNMSHAFHPYHIPQTIIPWYPNDGDLEFYFLGWTSETKRLNYVRMREKVLMGYYADEESETSSIYFFVKCGDINGVPVFTYNSDMVVRDEKTEWVADANARYLVRHEPKASRT